MNTHLHPTRALPHYLNPLPFVAILRGIETDQVLEVALAIYQQGWRCIEVPLNSPQALSSIELLAQKMPADCLIGAGTVLELGQIKAVAEHGGKLIVMPHCDSLQIETSKRYGLYAMPGVATISEAFTALRAGADALKLFPAESVAPSVLKAWQTVLPQDTICLPVGGIQTSDLASYWQAGARAYGIGGQLYRPGDAAAQVAQRAQAYALAFSALSSVN